MPVVVTFWQHPYDRNELLSYINNVEPILAIPSIVPFSPSELLPRSLDEVSQNHETFYFGLREDMTKILPEEKTIEGRNRYFISAMRWNVITLRLGQLKNRQLGQSNMSTYWDYPNESKSKMIRKPNEFITWAKKMFNHVRRMTKERISLNGYPYRATQRAKTAVDAGELSVEF